MGKKLISYYLWLVENGVVCDTRKEDFHDVGSQIPCGNARGLEIGCKVCHVGLQLCKCCKNQ